MCSVVVLFNVEMSGIFRTVLEKSRDMVLNFQIMIFGADK